jgi:large subunit ribosomal protein L3
MSVIIGRKIGMTRVFDEAGLAVPVTVVEAGPCPVVQVKNGGADGYQAVQLGFGRKKENRATRAEVGHAAKAGLDYAPSVLREFRLDGKEDAAFETGQQVTVETFAAGDKIKVTGTAKGRGFQGVVKRHGFAGRPGGHGHPLSRTPGSIGPGTDPSRVIKGKKLPGRMGGNQVTVRNLEIVRVDSERNLLFVKGAVPGSRNSTLFIAR